MVYFVLLVKSLNPQNLVGSGDGGGSEGDTCQVASYYIHGWWFLEEWHNIYGLLSGWIKYMQVSICVHCEYVK